MMMNDKTKKVWIYSIWVNIWKLDKGVDLLNCCIFSWQIAILPIHRHHVWQILQQHHSSNVPCNDVLPRVPMHLYFSVTDSLWQVRLHLYLSVADRPYSHCTVPGPLLRLTESQLAGLIPHDAPAEITQWRTTVLLSSRATEGWGGAMIWALGDQRNLKNVHKFVQEFTTVPETSNVTKECQNGRRRIIAETSPPPFWVNWQISLVLTIERTRRIGT